MHIFAAHRPLTAEAARPIVGLGVFTLHVVAIAGLSLSLRPPPVMIGGAPVVRLTLSPRASFDGVNAPRTSAASPRPSPATGQKPASEPASPEAPPPTLHVSRPATSGTETIVANHPSANDSNRSHHLPEGGGASPGEASDESRSGLTQGGGASVVGAAASTTADAYEAVVLAWIERHKRYPGGAAGAVTVRFTLDRRGAIKLSEVLASSGSSSVDHAALSQIADASPFPRPSPNASWRTRDFIVRIDFRSPSATRRADPASSARPHRPIGNLRQ